MNTFQAQNHYHEQAIECQQENAYWRPILAQRRTEFQERVMAPNVPYSIRALTQFQSQLDLCTSLKEKARLYEQELARLPKPITPEKPDEIHQRVCEDDILQVPNHFFPPSRGPLFGMGIAALIILMFLIFVFGMIAFVIHFFPHAP